MPELEIEFRRAEAHDAERLSTFAARVFPLGGRPGADSADIQAYIATQLTPERFRELIADPNTSVLVAASGREIVGYGVLVRDCRHPQIDAETQAEVRKFYVDPAFHGQGVARHLMRELLLGAANSGAIWLSVFSENPRAIRFYEWAGFSVIGKQDYWVGEDCQKDFVMQYDAAKGAR
jgi:ribosomal protein S18 acetylase RimI-like enzyme